MPKIKSFHVGNGDTFYIKHGSDNFTVIDCNLIEDRKKEIMDEIIAESKDKSIRRFISTHPDDDHILGLDYFYDRQEIMNFYVVNNSVKKDDETESFKFYKKLRDDDKKAFYIYKGCSRKWMNENSDERGSSGISILWPDTGFAEFQAELEAANESGHPNNISPIVQYSTGDIRFLWFGDLEHHFMESIQDKINMPAADIVFAPHHGRLSGAVPQKWLEQINPKVIIIGAAPSSELKYFTNYNQITQNSAWDITMYCDDNIVHIYSSNANYEKRDFLTDESRNSKPNEYYIGSFTARKKK